MKNYINSGIVNESLDIAGIVRRGGNASCRTVSHKLKGQDILISLHHGSHHKSR